MLLFLIITAVVGATCIGLGALVVSGLFDSRHAGPIGALVGLVLAAGLTGLFGWMAFGTEKTITFTVTGKERLPDGDNDKYVVYVKPTEGQRVGETLENTDAWFHGKTRSTDLQRQIKVGQTYTCKINGFRSGFLSSYRNILSCEGLVNG